MSEAAVSRMPTEDQSQTVCERRNEPFPELGGRYPIEQSQSNAVIARSEGAFCDFRSTRVNCRISACVTCFRNSAAGVLLLSMKSTPYRQRCGGREENAGPEFAGDDGSP